MNCPTAISTDYDRFPSGKICNRLVLTSLKLYNYLKKVFGIIFDMWENDWNNKQEASLSSASCLHIWIAETVRDCAFGFAYKESNRNLLFGRF
jgi:hypothetical protein